MKGLKGACLFAQSGGPTAVINASAAGVFLEAMEQELITGIYGAEHGVRGILEEKLIDIRKENREELAYLKNTPSSALGSVRYKLKPFETDERDYARILEIFRKYDIRYFFYNGGNDSMDTCNKIGRYFRDRNYDCNVIGVPKTIDNDLCGTDHCPGYPSAAKYVATSVMELYLDTHVYDTGMVTIIEVMGRNAGWLTAAASLASLKGYGPDLIYLPEEPFDVDAFIEDVARVASVKNNKVMVVISEGIKDKRGKYISEFLTDLNKDSFGHSQLGGTATRLAGIVNEKMNIKVRPIEFSLLQRCAAHLASATDIEEAFKAGQAAVRYACRGETGKMVVFKRKKSPKYEIEYQTVDLELAANAEKKVPSAWILPDHKGLTADFAEYALPLIQGKVNPPLEDGLPRFAKLKKESPE